MKLDWTGLVLDEMMMYQLISPNVVTSLTVYVVREENSLR